MPARKILVCATGLSPQIVTETVYALALGTPAWLPDEIHLITTAEGARRAKLTLLSDTPGWFARLRAEYDLPPMRFDANTIHVAKHADGTLLEDIRSRDDNASVADFIADCIRALTLDEQTELHVSLAGGRKTMGFYAGYALSLYGRAQDHLSHVLVSSPFETHPEFYYPTRASRTLYASPDSRPIDSRDATVVLAEIPFVRLRDGLPSALLDGGASFSEVVAEAQRALPPLRLEFEVAQGTIQVGDEVLTLKPAEFAFYCLLARRCHEGRAGIHWSDKNLEAEFASHYAQRVNPLSGAFERYEASGMSRETFHARKRHVNAALEALLGKRRAAPYLIRTLAALPGKGRCQPYALTLPPAAIRLHPEARPPLQPAEKDKK